MRRLIVATLVLVAAGCGQSAAPGYPPAYEMNFMRACDAQSTVPGLCACTWDKIEAEVPPADFTALERLPGPERETHPLTAQINGYALACSAQLSTEPTPAP